MGEKKTKNNVHPILPWDFNNLIASIIDFIFFIGHSKVRIMFAVSLHLFNFQIYQHLSTLQTGTFLRKTKI